MGFLNNSKCAVSVALMLFSKYAIGQTGGISVKKINPDAEVVEEIHNNNPRYPITSFKEKYCVPGLTFYFVHSNTKYSNAGKYFKDYFLINGNKFYLDSLTHTKATYDAQTDIASVWEVKTETQRILVLKADVGAINGNMLVFVIKEKDGRSNINVAFAKANTESDLYESPQMIKKEGKIYLKVSSLTDEVTALVPLMSN